MDIMFVERNVNGCGDNAIEIISVDPDKNKDFEEKMKSLPNVLEKLKKTEEDYTTGDLVEMACDKVFADNSWSFKYFRTVEF